MLKKNISSLMTLLAALLLASCASSHSTNHQTTADRKSTRLNSSH